MNRETTCCFTGHRPEKLPWREDEGGSPVPGAEGQAGRGGGGRLRKKGCGISCAVWPGERIFTAARRRWPCGSGAPGVTVEAVIPCEEQAARWRERDRERWFSLVERCDNETMLQHHYDRGCMLRRNRYLVDHSAMLIAVYDGMLGGPCIPSPMP